MTTLAFHPAIFTQQQAAQAASVIIKRVMTTSQPQHAAQIDWGNPITRGLVWAGYASANGINANRLTSPALTRPSSRGFGNYVATPGGSNNPITQTGPLGTFGDSYSLYALGSISSTSAICLAIDDDKDDTGPRCFQFRINAAKAELIVFDSGGTPYFATSPALDLAGLQTGVSMAAVVNGSAFSVFQNGVKTAAAVAVGSARPPTGDFFIGQHKGAGASGWSGALNLTLAWNRALTDAEIRSISANPWQIFQSTRPSFIETAQVAFDGKYRPSSDITDGTWTRTPSGTDLFSAIDEPTADDLDFISSPIAGSTPTTMAIGPIPAGAQTLRIRAGTSSGTATLTVELLNDSNTVLGTQTQALTSTVTTYSLNFSLASEATRVRIGVT